MLLALELSLKEKIEKQYEEWMACCPNKKREIDAWIKSADEDEAVCISAKTEYHVAKSKFLNSLGSL